jgi:hypothetical protein
MSKDEVILALKEIEAIETGIVEQTYVQYKWINGILWLGNYYIEDERQGLAFPYKDNNISLNDLNNFLNKQYKFS